MSDTQRIIKKCAICFAWLLVFSIFSGLFGAIFAVGSLFDDSKDIISHENVINVAEKSIKELDIEFESVKFIIRQTGDDFGISKSEYIDVKTTSGGIYISEKRRGLFEKRTDTVVLSIPDDFIFEEVSIETGAGKLEIDGLQTKTLDLELGAGKIDFNNIEVFREADIEGGAGAIVMKNCKFNDLSLDLGVGNFEFDGKLYGDNEINAGVGAINIMLEGNVDDYMIDVQKGLGKVTVGEEVAKNGSIIGTGVNKISVDGGIGEIDIDFTEKAIDEVYENNNI